MKTSTINKQENVNIQKLTNRMFWKCRILLDLVWTVMTFEWMPFERWGSDPTGGIYPHLIREWNGVNVMNGRRHQTRHQSEPPSHSMSDVIVLRIVCISFFMNNTFPAAPDRRIYLNGRAIRAFQVVFPASTEGIIASLPSVKINSYWTKTTQSTPVYSGQKYQPRWKIYFDQPPGQNSFCL